VGISEDAAYRLQARFIQDLITAIGPTNEKFFVGAS
jgi:hypothetical protein